MLLPMEGWTMMELDFVLAAVASVTVWCCLWQVVKCCWRRRQSWHSPASACPPHLSALPSPRGEQVLPAAPRRLPPTGRPLAAPHALGARPREVEAYRKFCIDTVPPDAPTAIGHNIYIYIYIYICT